MCWVPWWMEKPEEMWEPEQKLQGRVSSIPRLKGKAHPKKPRLGIRCKGSSSYVLPHLTWVWGASVPEFKIGRAHV